MSGSLQPREARRGSAIIEFAISFAFLFAVFENPQTHVQSIYYRGETATPASGTELLSFDALPYEAFAEDAVRVMLKRYADERQQGRFKIYSGNHERGEVRALG